MDSTSPSPDALFSVPSATGAGGDNGAPAGPASLLVADLLTAATRGLAGGSLPLHVNSGYVANPGPGAWSADAPAGTELSGGTEGSAAMGDLVEAFKQAMAPLPASGTIRPEPLISGPAPFPSGFSPHGTPPVVVPGFVALDSAASAPLSDTAASDDPLSADTPKPGSDFGSASGPILTTGQPSSGPATVHSLPSLVATRLTRTPTLAADPGPGVMSLAASSSTLTNLPPGTDRPVLLSALTAATPPLAADASRDEANPVPSAAPSPSPDRGAFLPGTDRPVPLSALTADTPNLAADASRDEANPAPSAAPTPSPDRGAFLPGTDRPAPLSALTAATPPLAADASRDEANPAPSAAIVAESIQLPPGRPATPATETAGPAAPPAESARRLDAVTIAAASTPGPLARSAPKRGPVDSSRFDVSATVAAPTDEDAGSIDPSAQSTDSLGDAVLQSLRAQSGVAAPAAAPGPRAEVAGVSPGERQAQLARSIADTVTRVLVSDPLHDGNRELRIDFAPEVLPDTSVRIWRSEGHLNVEFISTATVADSGLRAGLPQLAEAIQRQSPLGEAPVISLRLGDSAGQPGDGRSRQQYFADEENGEPT